MAHSTWRNHEKRADLAEFLGVSSAAAYGHANLLWDYAYEKRIGPDGVLVGMTARHIARAAEWTGDPEVCVAAFVRAKLLEVTDSALFGSITWAIHDYWEGSAGIQRRPEARKG